MDTSALATLVPAGGLGTIFLVLVGYLLKQIPADRAEYREDLSEERGRTVAAEARTDAALERAELAQLQVDEERRLRRDAETRAAAAESKLEVQRSLLRWYAADRERLLRYLPPEVPPGIIPDAPGEEDPP